MKRILIFAFVIFALICVQKSFAADKAEIGSQINKVKASIEKLKSEVSDTTTFAEDILKAQHYIKLAEDELNKNITLIGSITGSVKSEAVPTINHYISLSELTIAVVKSKVEKMKQENENSGLAKLIPELEAKIKTVEDKNAEIKRLRGIIEKPKEENAQLEKEIAALKNDKANLSAQVETLNASVASLKKELSEKTKAYEHISMENKSLKDQTKTAETQKIADITQMKEQLNNLTKLRDLLWETGKGGFISRVSERDITLIIPRSYFIKNTPKGIGLSPEAERHVHWLSSVMNRFSEYKVVVKVFGFGLPAKNENVKATEQMAKLIKGALVEKGVNASSIEAIGAGDAKPIFSQKAVEENRRVEISFVY
ncbi:MAG: hypothetical protein M1147_01850 [Nitrospirae bacterium]|nr:hypothetical protein [Nitrospirota bacterium]MCL5976854.1 hypothetical protein [Nitrospirota bacterium]